MWLDIFRTKWLQHQRCSRLTNTGRCNSDAIMHSRTTEINIFLQVTSVTWFSNLKRLVVCKTFDLKTWKSWKLENCIWKWKVSFQECNLPIFGLYQERIILARMMRITAAIEGDIKDCTEKILLPFADDLTAEIK